DALLPHVADKIVLEKNWLKTRRRIRPRDVIYIRCRAAELVERVVIRRVKPLRKRVSQRHAAMLAYIVFALRVRCGRAPQRKLMFDLQSQQQPVAVPLSADPRTGRRGGLP